MIDRGGLGRRLRGRRSRRDHPVSPVPGRYRCPRPLSSGLPRRAAPAARSHAAGPTGLPGALPFPRGGGGPTTGVSTAAAPRDARRAGITAAAGTRPCPRLRGGGCGPASLARSPSLPRAPRIGQVPRLLPSLDVRAVSQARSPESNPDSPPGVGPSARRDRADRVMPRKPGRAVAASRCSPAGARPCAHVLAPGCQRCPASRDRRGGCNRCPEPSAASRVSGHAWLRPWGERRAPAGSTGWPGAGAAGRAPPCAGAAAWHGGRPLRAHAVSGVPPIVLDGGRPPQPGQSPSAPHFFGFPWGPLTPSKKPALTRQSTLSYIVRDRSRPPHTPWSPPAPHFFEIPWGRSGGRGAGPRGAPGGPGGPCRTVRHGKPSCADRVSRAPLPVGRSAPLHLLSFCSGGALDCKTVELEADCASGRSGGPLRGDRPKRLLTGISITVAIYRLSLSYVTAGSERALRGGRPPGRARSEEGPPTGALRTEAAPGAVRAPGCSGGTGVQEAAGETGVFTGPGDRLLWAVRGSFRALPAVSCTVPPRRPSPHVGVSPGRAWPAGGAGSPCWPLCLDPPGRLPRASLRRCAAHAGPLRVPVSLCAGQARWWARTALRLPLGPLHSLNLLFPRLPVWPMHTPPEQVNRAPRPALCRRVPQAIAGLCAVQERRAGWSPRAAAARRRGTGLGRAAGRGARRGARLEAVSAGPPGAAARRCPAGQPRGWRPAAGVPLVLARRALAPGPVG